MTNVKYLIAFQSEDEPNVFVQADAGENLMNVAKRAGVAINAPCSGNGSCGKCLVRIVSGALESPKSFYIDDVEYEQGWRMACISRVAGDAVIQLRD